MQRLSESQKGFLLEAMRRYEAALPGSPAAEYLTARGLDGPEISKFHLGFVEDPPPGHEMHRGSLAIPYIRAMPKRGGSVVSIRFRCIQQHDHVGHGKYMTVAGDRPRLFNTPALLAAKPDIAITEGEIDAITSELAGLPAVGVPGAEAWQRHFREPFLGYRTVFVLADGDEAGTRFANTVAKTLPNSKVIPCPPGSDVNQLVNEQGQEALLERIR